MAPKKIQQDLRVYNEYWETELKVSLPILNPYRSEIMGVQIWVGDSLIGLSKLLESMHEVAQEVYTSKMPIIYGRAVLRAISKYTGTRWVENIPEEEDSFFAHFLEFTGDLYKEGSEKADLRSWTSLPGNIFAHAFQLDPGSYEITLQVNNGSCATDTLTQTINIEGTPSVNINAVGGDSEQICMDSSDIPYVIDFSSSYTPEYSDGVFTPANYSWEISGDDISASDYSFINSSSSSSIYPTIQFNSFGCYTITNTVTGNCGTSSSDSFTISLDQNPVANFEILKLPSP